jgi:hypothetical protein
MNWPARTPDLNPMEHLLDNMGRRLQEQTLAPANLKEIRQRVVQIWEDIYQGAIRALTESMHRRCQAVIRSRGENTSY